MGLLESGSGKNGILTVVFASLFLVSIGLISHSAFADKVVSTISIPPCNCGMGFGPTGVGVNPNTNTIYVAVGGGWSGTGGAVYVINDTTDSVSSHISTDGGPGGVAVNPNTNKIYVTNEGVWSTRPQFYSSHSVFVINGSTNSILSTITVGSGPYGIGINPNTNKIYVANSGSNTVSVIDGATDIVTSTITVGTNPQSVDVNPNTNMVYVANSGSNTVSVIDGATDGITSTISGFNNPAGIGVNPNTNKIYVANFNNGTLSVIDGSTKGTIGSIFVGNGASEVRINPVTNKIYVSVDGTYGSGVTVSVVNGSTDTFLQALQVPTGPRGIGINPTMNKIYASSYFYDTVSVIDGSSSNPSTVPSSPSTPQNLQAAGFVGPDNYINISWSAPSTDGGSQVTNYKIYKSTSSGTETLYGVTNNGLSYTIYGETSGQTYFFKVIAVTSFGESGLSNEANATIPGQPSSPNELTATPVSSSEIDLSWLPPDQQGSSPITGYEIERESPVGGGFSTIVANTGNAGTSYHDTGLAPNTEYNYMVSAINSAGTGSPSYSYSATTFSSASVPSAPQNLSATAGNAQVSLSWDASSSDGGSAITSYNVYRGTTASAESSTPIASTTSVTYTDTGLKNGQAYYYKVTAVNSIGESPQSNEASTTPTAPTSSGSGSSSITLNNVQSTSGTTDSSNQIALSGFNTGTGSNQLLLVGISANNNSPVSVTFNGAQLAHAVGSFYNNDAEFWYLKNPTGTGDVIVTMGGPTQAVVGAYSFSGVNQTASVATHVAKHNTTPNSPNISITTKYPNDLVLDLPSIYGGSTLGSPTCTQQWNVNVPNAITGASSSMTVPSPATVTCKWVASSADFWDDVAIELRAAG